MSGGFQPVIDDGAVKNRDDVRRVVVCSGKVFYDLEAAREESKATHVALVRLEQFYPFPAAGLKEILASYNNATEIAWTQEEPKNMGGWTFVEPRLREIKPEAAALEFIGRAPSASPATGSYSIHNLEQAQIVEKSLAASKSETVGNGKSRTKKQP